MAAVSKPLYIEQGATFTLGFTWYRGQTDANGNPVLDANGNPVPGSPYDLTGCTARMQVRRKQGDPPLVTATSESPNDASGNPDPALIAAGAGRIKLGGTTGRVDVTLTDDDTDHIDAKTAMYDLEIEWPLQSGELRPRVDRLLMGTVDVSPNITQNTVDLVT